MSDGEEIVVEREPVQPAQDVPGEHVAHVEALYVAHHRTIRDYLYQRCRNGHLADDLASETFERAILHLIREDISSLQNPVAWLKTVARNLLTDHYRRAANRHEIASANVAVGQEDSGALDQAILYAETISELGPVMKALTQGQRDALGGGLLDLSTRETADRMGRTPQAVRNLRHKARRRINDLKAAANE